MIMKDKTKKGFLLVLATAFISGISIFVNKFGIAMSDPYVFAGLKNTVVAVFLVGALLLINKQSLKEIKGKQWLLLLLIGLIGGAIPFLMFFKGLSLTLAVKAGFIHKSMFLVIALMSVVFLKNKPSKYVWVGIISLLIGNILFLNIKPQALNIGDLLVFGSVLLWSVEILLSKKLLNDLPANIVAGSRMFFGSIFIWVFLLITGKFSLVTNLSMEQWGWVGITAVLLIAYVTTFYSGLKHVSAVEATSVLALGAPITAILTMVFLDKSMSGMAFIGIAFIIFGLYIMYSLKSLNIKQWRLLRNR
ncbi:DMT family transporter [Patescibacteria group bacterium]|nr:DMT family transporter [Patescibacteria group bacterium]